MLWRRYKLRLKNHLPVERLENRFLLSAAQILSRMIVDSQQGAWYPLSSATIYWNSMGVGIGSRSLLTSSNRTTIAGTPTMLATHTVYQQGEFPASGTNPPVPSGTTAGFVDHDIDWPSYALQYYSADQSTQGSPPIYMTATYAGSDYPLYMNDFATTGNFAKAIDVGDDRYINFFANDYARGNDTNNVITNTTESLLQPSSNQPTTGDFVSSDNGGANDSTYGIWNGSSFVSTTSTGVAHWDQPFPQSSDAYMDANAYFLNRVQELSPDAAVSVSMGSLPGTARTSPADIESVYGGLSDIDFEGFMSGDSQFTFTHDTVWAFLQALASPVMVNKTQDMRFENIVNSADEQGDLFNDYVAYKVYGGPNAIFDAQLSGDAQVDPSIWAPWENSLGSAIGATQTVSQGLSDPAYEYSYRQFQGGYAYFNRENVSTGVSVIIPSGTYTEYDVNDSSGTPTFTDAGTVTGNGTSTFTIGAPYVYDSTYDEQGVMLVADPAGTQVAAPVMTRFSALITGPASITVQDLGPTGNVSTGTTIYYTTNNTTPSPTNFSGIITAGSGTVTLNPSSATAYTLQAMAVESGMTNSWVSGATYNVLPSTSYPSVNFHLPSNGASDDLNGNVTPNYNTTTKLETFTNGSAQNSATYILVQLSNLSSQTVTMGWTLAAASTAISGTDYTGLATSGTVTFAPYTQYAYIPVTILPNSSTSDRTIVLNLGGTASNGVVGSQNTFTYTIFGKATAGSPKLEMPIDPFLASSGTNTAQVTALGQELAGGTTTAINSGITYTWNVSSGVTFTNHDDTASNNGINWKSTGVEPQYEDINVSLPALSGTNTYKLTLTLTDSHGSSPWQSSLYLTDTNGVVTLATEATAINFATAFSGAASAQGYYVRLASDGSTEQIWVGAAGSVGPSFGNPTYSTALADLPSLTFGPDAGNDSLTVDFGNGSPVPNGTITFKGSSLTVLGTAGNDTFTVNSGAVLFGTSSIKTINFSNVQTLSIDPQGGADSLAVNAGTVNLPAQSTGGGILNRTFSTLTIAAGTSLLVGTNAASHPDRTLIVADSLSINPTGKLDLGGNDMIVRGGGNFSTLTALLLAGYAAGAWNGNGIDSVAAHSDTTHLTTLAMIPNLNSAGTGVAYGTFDNQTGLLTTDVIIKQTYYGDADLSGTVTGSDYSRIDNGYLMQLTGWYNGDFNYDGVVNGSDYTLIDNTFNQQGASLADIVSIAATQVNRRLVSGSTKTGGAPIAFTEASSSFTPDEDLMLDDWHKKLGILECLD